MAADITFYIHDGLLTGTAGKKTWSIQARSGGGGGARSNPGGNSETDNPSAVGIKTDASHRGGPLPPGSYVIAKPADNGHLGYSAELTPTAEQQKHMLGRSGFFIHGQGPKGSDGCIVPVEHFADFMDALAKDGGGKLTVVASKTPAKPAAPQTVASGKGKFGVDCSLDTSEVMDLAKKLAGQTLHYNAPKDASDSDNGASGTVSFMGLYLGRNLKQKSTADAIIKLDIDVFSIFEHGYPTKAEYFTPEQGKTDGERALKDAKAAGQPKTAAIYFTVDCDPAGVGKAKVVEYFKAVKAVVGTAYPIGCYGGGAALKWLTEAKLITHIWQISASWAFQDNKASYPGAHLRQYKTDQKLLGKDVDFDFSPGGQFGGWNQK